MSGRSFTGSASAFYRVALSVADTVNLAIDLHRPLLVEGEPGCGKTKLAEAIAAELELGDVTKITVRSTMQARDLLYRFDALRRLQDVQDPKRTDAQYVFPYIQLGPLGEAIRRRKRCVVLIDEIDKADIDFPNDLLDVLDSMSFTVDDLPVQEDSLCLEKRGFGRFIESGVKSDPESVPIVVITSNREKQLPDPFLRRCIYVHLRFPRSAQELEAIAELNLRVDKIKFNQDLVAAASEAFRRVREASIRSDARKPPSTSELIDWIKILHWRGLKPQDLSLNPLLPPYWEILFKNQHDLDAYSSTAAAQRAESG